MRIREAVRLVIAGHLSRDQLYAIATTPELVQIALILGRPEDLPAELRRPGAAWRALNAQQRRIVTDLAPAEADRWLDQAPADSSRPVRSRGPWRPLSER